MADRRPPAPKLLIACKPPVVQAALPPTPAQQEQDAVQHAQQDPVQPPAPPDQVPNPVQPPAPPAQIPDPVQIPQNAPPAQVSNPVQPLQIQVQPG